MFIMNVQTTISSIVAAFALTVQVSAIMFTDTVIVAAQLCYRGFLQLQGWVATCSRHSPEPQNTNPWNL